MTAVQFVFAPFLLFYVVRTVDFPWEYGWWWLYLVIPFLILPFAFWASTYAVHRTEVTVVKPLIGISGVAALVVGVSFFGEEISMRGIGGVVLIVGGLFALYHGRWESWKERGPWIIFICAFIFGATAACEAAVLSRFPHPLVISAMILTGSLCVSFVPAISSYKRIPLNRKSLLILFALPIVSVLQIVLSVYALMYGPSGYVMSVKRTSILLTAVIGYAFLKERDQSLPRLLVASGLVVGGVVMLTVG